MMNRLLFQFSRRSSSLLSTTRPIPILNRTYSSDATLMRERTGHPPLGTVPRFHQPPLPVRKLHEKIESLIEEEKFDAASSTLRKAIISGISPMEHTWMNLLESMCDSALYDDTISLLKFLYKDSTLINNDFLVRAHLGSGRVDEALRVYHIIQDSIDPDLKDFNYSHFIQGLVAANRMLDAIKVLRDMLASNVMINPMAFNCIISAYLQLNDFESANKLFNEFLEIIHERRYYDGADGVVFATLMDHYFENNMEKQAMQLYQDFLGWKVRMTADTCNAMLEVFLKYGKLAEAESIFEGILDLNGPPNLATFRILFDAYNEQNRIDDLLKWLNYMLFKTKMKPKSKLLDSVLSKLVNKGRSKEVVEILEKIPAGSVKTFPVSSYEIILAELCTEGKVDKVIDLLRIREKHSISITAMLHGIIYEAFANATKTDQIEEMLGMPILAICANPREAHLFQHSSTIPMTL